MILNGPGIAIVLVDILCGHHTGKEVMFVTSQLDMKEEFSSECSLRPSLLSLTMRELARLV